ncbi:FecR domain-containing protein [Croceibacterium sp. LX-88]|uniref:FecR domain-containing protein n=1 Tax=Croceibacterium selenioxidans TaxID=2838833 RepID=A0ABS5W699_9SPHN|nr:FecR domain-containing protein [Croceibacterium selenioxidans]MBT2134622.1 FecR domain-containing protein [Croceibacterium selenioxidans]
MLREALTLERLSAMAPDEAAAWFLAQRDEGLAAHEETILADWLAADQAHGEAYRRAERAWEAFAGAEDNEVVAAMRTHALSAKAPSRRPTPQMAMAAAVLMAVVLGVVLLFGRMTTPQAEVVRYDTEREVRDIRLPDGSLMTLDAQSEALASFSDQERSLELRRGRALFAVEKDRSRPFVVSAGARRVVALGTQFEVDLLPAGLTVTLFEGRVAIEPKSGKALATLSPGEQYLETNGSSVVRKLAGDDLEPAAWRNGLLNFDDRSLEEAVAEVNRYAREPIVIRDPKVGAMRISGQFKAGDAERFARTVAEVYPLQVVRQAGQLELVTSD